MRLGRSHWLWAAPAALVAASATAQLSESMIREVGACYDKGSDAKFSSLRNVFPLGRQEVDLAMLEANRRPSSAQMEALRLYRREVVDCASAAMEPRTPSKDIDWAEGARSLRFDLLATGRISFAEFALFSKADTESANHWIAALKQVRQEALNEPRSVTGLVCTFEAGVLAGIELVVQFDESTNAVKASRGAAISKSWVTSTEIGFTQEKLTTVISRLTGRLSSVADQAGMAGTGSCGPAPKQRF
jgi:hypothetical protein